MKNIISIVLMLNLYFVYSQQMVHYFHILPLVSTEELKALEDQEITVEEEKVPYTFSVHNLKRFTPSNKTKTKETIAHNKAVHDHPSAVSKGLFYDDEYVFYYVAYLENDQLLYKRYKFSKELNHITTDTISEDDLYENVIKNKSAKPKVSHIESGVDANETSTTAAETAIKINVNETEKKKIKDNTSSEKETAYSSEINNLSDSLGSTTSIIYFYRTSMSGAVLKYNYYDGEKNIGKSKAGEIIKYECKPGVHHFAVLVKDATGFYAPEYITLNVKSNEEYYIKAVTKGNYQIKETIAYNKITSKNKLDRGKKGVFQLVNLYDNPKELSKAKSKVANKTPLVFSKEELQNDEIKHQELVSKSFQEYLNNL